MKEYTNTAKYDSENDSATFVTCFLGSVDEIKALYKSIVRNKHTNIYPTFDDFPKFSVWKAVYALLIYDNKQMLVINSDMFAMMLLDGDIEEVPKKRT